MEEKGKYGNKVELKPCPFCGSKPDFKEMSRACIAGDLYVRYAVECPNCHIYFGGESRITVNVSGKPVLEHDAFAECIEKWNRRVSE